MKAACAVVPVGGSERYLYRGAILPDGVKAADLKRFTELGLIEEVDIVTAVLEESDPSTTSDGQNAPETAAERKARLAAEKAEADQAAADKVAAEKVAAEKAAADAAAAKAAGK
ncbi:hypothetical protein BGP79_11865 [Tersicoccus sp. Bi-70]|nr:hypothetical protein BGP79_11865 [Tersicoccus sp. Bi-70]